MDSRIFQKTAEELYLKANFEIRPDIKKALLLSLKREKNKLARRAIRAILKNAEYAFQDKVAICQDTGYPVFFIKLGKVPNISAFKIQKALTQGIKDATLKGFLRSSVLSDPLRRVKSTPNIPPIFHIELSNRDEIEITLLVKGFGSENQTRLYLLNPNPSRKEIINKIAGHIKNVGASACPPYIIGIGIGGTSDKALILSKQATLLDINRKSQDLMLARLEQDIKKAVNKLGIGPLGLGGKTTCLGVRILTHPTHIAGLPLAISVGCHATRSAQKVIKLKVKRIKDKGRREKDKVKSERFKY